MGLSPLPQGYRFYYTLHPRPTVLLATRCPNGRVNLMPASWNMPVSEEPPTIAVAIDKESYTFECLEYHPEATINIPSSQHLDLVYALGSVSGRSIDKVNRYGIQLEESLRISVPRWKDAIASIEAKVYEKLDVGEVGLYVFEVVGVYVDLDLYTRWGWDFRKTNLLLHGAGRSFYLVGKWLRAKKNRDPTQVY